MVLHLLAVRLGLMPSALGLFGRAGEVVEDLTRTGLQVLDIAPAERPPETPPLPPEVLPDAAGEEPVVEFQLAPPGFDTDGREATAPGGETGSGARAPVPLTVPWVKYPDSAIRDGISGTVRLRVLVGADGRVDRVEVVRGLRPDCDRAARDAARGLVFEPAVEDGRSVRAWVEYDIAFDPGKP